MKRFVYNEKYVKLLVMMEGKKSQIDELARGIGANSGHLRIVLEQWHKEEIITKDKPGRDYVIGLTDKGAKLAHKFAEIMQLVEHYKPEQQKPAADSVVTIEQQNSDDSADKLADDLEERAVPDIPKPEITNKKGGKKK